VLSAESYAPLAELLLTSLSYTYMAASPAQEIVRCVKNKEVVAIALVDFFAAHNQVCSGEDTGEDNKKPSLNFVVDKYLVGG
jgi:hypothetical protein